MECSLAALIACFSWSNLYIDSDLLAFRQGVQTHVYKDWWYDGQTHFENERTVVNHRANNPYGRISIGYQLDFGNLVLGVHAEHTSSLANSDDRGINGLAIKARWYPFRH